MLTRHDPIQLIAQFAKPDRTYRLLVVAADPPASDRGGLYRQAETLRVLSRTMVAHITHVRPGDTKSIAAWLVEHGATTDISFDDAAFFAEQLRLARQEVAAT